MEKILVGTFSLPQEFTNRLKGMNELDPWFVTHYIRQYCPNEKGIICLELGDGVYLEDNSFYGKILIEKEVYHCVSPMEQKLHGVEAFILKAKQVSTDKIVYLLYRPFETEISVITSSNVLMEEIQCRFFRRVHCLLNKDGEGGTEVLTERVYTLMKGGLGLKAKRDEVVVRKYKDGAIVKEKKWLYKPMYFATRAYPEVGEYIGKI